ncbi:MAG: hypothetical protein U9R75_02445 [Candidatus Thermoplasmatota archaeon]|nr:hypothetical protein [Candidatus Thermoplasmatota archaeon]
MDVEILHTVGDDPLNELMDLDQYYGWTRRIGVLKSIFTPRKRSKWRYFPLIIFLALFFASLGILSYLLFF